MSIHHAKTRQDLNKLIQEHQEYKYMLVDFYATWCGPCKTISPLFEDWSKQYSSILFVKVNIDDAPELAKLYQIKSLPTFLMIDKDDLQTPRNRVVGAKIKEIETMLKLFEQYSVKINEDF